MNNGSTISKSLDIPYKDFAKAHLTLLNILLPKKLTNQEIDILSSFISLDETLVKISGLFGTISRKEVRKLNNNIGASHLGNIIKSLKEKKYIYEEDGELKIQNYLVVKPNLKEGEKFKLHYSFTLNTENEKR